MHIPAGLSVCAQRDLCNITERGYITSAPSVSMPGEDIDLFPGNVPCGPGEIVRACVFSERSGDMSDFVMNESDRVSELHLIKGREKVQGTEGAHHKGKEKGRSRRFPPLQKLP